MTKSTERDFGLLSMVERLMRKPGEAEAAQPVPDSTTQAQLDPVVDVIAAPAMLEPQLAVEGQRSRSRMEMADLILRALRGIDGCPKQGFEVTVYGTRPWNAMLRITPAAGPVRDAQVWQERVREMVARMRVQYELLDEDQAPM